MKTTRRLTLMIGVAVLALVVIFALQANRPSSAQAPTSQPYTGMGEWRRFEVQQMEESRAVAGIGDLRRYEAQAQVQALIPITGGTAGSPAVGMGNLRRFEVQAGSIQLDSGMGNLRRFESQPSTSNSSTPQSSLPSPAITDLSRPVHSDNVNLLAESVSKGPGR
jgi:hypothetical protein